MSSAPFDLAVIGGGVNGCGIARDAAGRGARVLLLEKGDLARGTSSASTKLIHGGLRYLEHYEFGLVREALAERERLWAIAPHIVRPERFVLPHVSGLRPTWLLRLGLFLYDHLGGRRLLPGTERIDLARHPAGAPLHEGLRTGFIYSDCRVDDARLVVLNARDAAERGASICTRCEVLGLAADADGWRIETPSRTFFARAVVNAAGPGVVDLLKRAGLPAEHGLRLVRGSHIVVPRLFDHDLAYFFQLSDGRIFFAIPYEHDFTLIGTTDVDHHGAADRAEPSAEEIAYLCEAANGWFRRKIGPEHVVWAYAGVRPLVDDGSGKPEAATRGYRFELTGGQDGSPPLLSVFGGKITTYRHLAEAAMAQLAPFVRPLGGSGWTDMAALPGGNFPVGGIGDLMGGLLRDFPFLGAQTAERVARAYGTEARNWLGAARGWGDLGESFGHGLSAAEVEWMVDKEWAVSAEDVLWRRSKLGLRFSAGEVERLGAWLVQG